MKVAAYQAPLFPTTSLQPLELIRQKVQHCESEGVTILCCPEAILGGLADDAAQPAAYAIDAENGQLNSVLAPLASPTVTTIIGFTELRDGHLFNTAAVYQNGAVTGLYRKLHPAIRQSVYQPGSETPIFTVDGLTFGILICNDSNFEAPARAMAAQGAAALFIPTNNSLPAGRGSPELVAHTRNIDVARAAALRVAVIRADVSGSAEGRVSYGSSAIIDSHGTILQAAPLLSEALLTADIEVVPRG